MKLIKIVMLGLLLCCAGDQVFGAGSNDNAQENQSFIWDYIIGPVWNGVKTIIDFIVVKPIKFVFSPFFGTAPEPSDAIQPSNPGSQESKLKKTPYKQQSRNENRKQSDNELKKSAANNLSMDPEWQNKESQVIYDRKESENSHPQQLAANNLSMDPKWQNKESQVIYAKNNNRNYPDIYQEAPIIGHLQDPRTNVSAIIKLLTNKNINLSEVNHDRNTPLHLAAKRNLEDLNNIQIMLHLIEYAKKTNQEHILHSANEMNKTPIDIALRVIMNINNQLFHQEDYSKYYDLLKALIPPLLDEKSRSGNAMVNFVLGAIATYGSPEDLEYLFLSDTNNHIDVNAKLTYTKETALHLVITSPSSPEFKLEKIITLVKHNANIDEQNYRKETPLVLALTLFTRNRFEMNNIARYLIDQGADVNIQNDKGITAIFYALQSENIEIANLLIKKGADITVNKGSVLRYMKHPEKHISLVEYLLNNGADINAKKPNGTTMLHYAMENALYEFAIFLIINGADVNAQDNEKRNGPLHNFVFIDSDGFTDAEIASGAFMNKRYDENLLTNLINCFYNNGANLNLRNKKGATILDTATQPLVKKLLKERGALTSQELDAQQNSQGNIIDETDKKTQWKEEFVKAIPRQNNSDNRDVID